MDSERDRPNSSRPGKRINAAESGLEIGEDTIHVDENRRPSFGLRLHFVTSAL